ncbi:hypothetical protein EDD90_7431 [Streptomyces sp. Ag109_O5-1]|nr:hypothetical protein EDD90_7431 [Streptomyces sp. Ag109_O5-1]
MTDCGPSTTSPGGRTASPSRFRPAWGAPHGTRPAARRSDAYAYAYAYAYAKALQATRVPVAHRVFEGADRHFTHADPVPAGKEAIESMARPAQHHVNAASAPIMDRRTPPVWQLTQRRCTALHGRPER